MGDVTSEELESGGIDRIQLQEQKITFTRPAVQSTGESVQIKVARIQSTLGLVLPVFVLFAQ